MEWFHDFPYLVKNVSLKKSRSKILNFVAALQRKSETTKPDYNFDWQRLLKIYVRHFSLLLYLKAFQKTIKNLFISSQTILYPPYFPWWPFCRRKYILTILNFMTIVGKRCHTPPFPRFTLFWKSKMSPPFLSLSGKQKYWITHATNLYKISTLKVS